MKKRINPHFSPPPLIRFARRGCGLFDSVESSGRGNERGRGYCVSHSRLFLGGLSGLGGVFVPGAKRGGALVFLDPVFLGV